MENMQKLAALEGDGFYTTTYEVIGDDSSEPVTVRTTYIAADVTVPVTDDDEYWADAYIGVGKRAAVDFSGSSDNIVVNLGHDSDVTVSDIVAQGGTAFESIAAVRGGDGDFIVSGSSAPETLYAGRGDSSLYGADGRDVLISDGNSKFGSATFFFGVGDGKDTIYGFEERDKDNAATADMLVIETSADAVPEYRIIGDNLRISYNSSDQLTLVDSADDILQINGDVAAIGTDLDYQDFVNRYIGLGDSAQVEIGDHVGDVNIWMNLGTWARANDVEGFEEFGVYEDIKVLDASDFWEGATLVGGFGVNNEIYAGHGVNSLWGGNGGDDTLYAGEGMSQYFYLNNDGNDVIEGAKNDEVINLLNIGLEEFDFEGGKPLEYDSDHIKLNFADGGSLDVKSSADVVFEIKDGSQWKLDRNANVLNYQGGRREE